MRAIGRLMAVAALVFALTPDSAAAQRWTWDVGLHGGYSMWTNMAGEASGADKIHFESGPFAAAHLGWWGSRFGLRANTSFSERSLGLKVAEDDEEVVGMENINVWSGSLDALFRLKAPRDNWEGGEFLPFLALGLGGRWVNPPGDDADAVCNDTAEGKQWACQIVLLGLGDPNRGVALGEQKGLLGHVGLGADMRLSPGFAIRLEAFDKISKPQMYQSGARSGANPILIALPNGDEQVGKWAHELGIQAGLNMTFGLRPVAPVAVVTAPPPPPPPPPPAPTTPRPAPREESVSICVIDPSATGGTRMQMATYRVEQRDTVYMVDGSARPIRTAAGNVMVARDAGWLVRGEPLNMTVGRETVRFLPYQGGRTIASTQVVYLGNINGYPVYANRDEVADVITVINTARGTRTDADLGTLLTDARARDVVQGVQYLYVPLDPIGCVFQPIAPQQDVRKGGK
jgi:hypothetical protein